jgi:hypothetical protein
VKEIKVKLDVAKKTQHALWEKVQPAVDRFNALKTELDQMYKDREDLTEETKIEQKKIELIELEIGEVRKKMNEVVNKFYKDEDEYYVQQKLIRKIEWMTNEKERALRTERIKKEREEEEKARIPIHPYIEEMELCDQLIAYCKKFSPAKKEEEKKEIPKPENKDLSAKINKGELKVVENKKKKEEQLMIIGGGKKKKDKTEKKKAKKPADAPRVPVDLGMLALFDKVGVQAPLFMKDLHAATEKLGERKKYFETLPEIEKKKAEEKKPEEKKPEEKKPEEKKPEEKKLEEKKLEEKKPEEKKPEEKKPEEKKVEEKKPEVPVAVPKAEEPKAPVPPPAAETVAANPTQGK